MSRQSRQTATRLALADRERLTAYATAEGSTLSQWIRAAIDLRLATEDRPLLVPFDKPRSPQTDRRARRLAPGTSLTQLERQVRDAQPPRRRRHWLDDIDPGDWSVYPSGQSGAMADHIDYQQIRRQDQRFGRQELPWKGQDDDGA